MRRAGASGAFQRRVSLIRLCLGSRTRPGVGATHAAHCNDHAHGRDDDGGRRHRCASAGDHAKVQPFPRPAELLPGRRGGALGEGDRGQDQRQGQGRDPQRRIAARQADRAGQPGEEPEPSTSHSGCAAPRATSFPAARSSSCRSWCRTRGVDRARCGISTGTARWPTNTRTTGCSPLFVHNPGLIHTAASAWSSRPISRACACARPTGPSLPRSSISAPLRSLLQVNEVMDAVKANRSKAS